MNACYLHKPDGTATDISQCGSCGKLAGRGNFDISEKCCTCYDCGLPLAEEDKKYASALYHRACDDQRRAEISADRLEKAELAEGYDGPVYCDGVPGGWGDGFFADMEDLLDSMADEEEDADRPEFVHCCNSRQACHVNLDHILESATEDAHEDARDGLAGCDDLAAAVEVFNELNEGLLTYDIDYKRKVAVPPAVATS